MKIFLRVAVAVLCSLPVLEAIANHTTHTSGPKDDKLKWANLPPVYFCGEAVPLHQESVARRLVSALVQKTNYNRALYEIRQRASSFFPIIEPIMDRYKIPSDFKYLPLVESSLHGGAVSSAGAVGYWQLMPATARELGLTVDGQTDERLNLVKSTHAACRYLRFLHKRLGSWTLAAAAYNNGIGNILSSIRRQSQRNYYYLHLNAETGKYLYRILAFKELFGNYNSYRLVLSPDVWKILSEPLPNVSPTLLPEKILLAESAITHETQQAVVESASDDTDPKREEEMPLPNAADVFRGGIKARLVEAGTLKRGQIWVFCLTRDGMADGKPVDEGDVLYAVVEDIDAATNRVFLRADRVFSKADGQTHRLAISAMDAATGRMGINLSDLEHMKAGWISTWQVL